MSDAIIRGLARQLKTGGLTETFILELLDNPEVNWSDAFLDKTLDQLNFLKRRSVMSWKGNRGTTTTVYRDLSDDRLTSILEAHKRGSLADGRPFGVGLAQLTMLTRELQFRGLELLDDQNTYW